MSYNKFMNTLTHVNFTQNKHAFQLRMNFDVDTLIPEDSKVRLVCNIVEEMNLEPLLSTQKKKGRKPKDLVSMLKILLFCYSQRIVSTRDIEDFYLRHEGSLHPPRCSSSQPFNYFPVYSKNRCLCYRITHSVCGNVD